MHFLFLSGTEDGLNTARMASSKTFLSPFCVRAEHSTYWTAPMVLAMARPCGWVTGASLRSASPATAAASSLRSTFVPTSMIGTERPWIEIEILDILLQLLKTCRYLLDK